MLAGVFRTDRLTGIDIFFLDAQGLLKNCDVRLLQLKLLLADFLEGRLEL